jgi:uncharacterized protein YcfJ
VAGAVIGALIGAVVGKSFERRRKECMSDPDG